MNKNERLMLAIGEIDEKYVKESEGKMRKSTIIKVAVGLCLLIAFGLHLFLPFAPVTSDLTAYEGSSYFPLIEGIEDYRLSFKQPKFKNNWEGLLAIIDSLSLGIKGEDNSAGDMAPDMEGTVGGDGSIMGNGSYVENTDNQVAGVIESDLMKMTDKYIFRLGFRTDVNYRTPILRVYSIDKENSALVAEFEMPRFENEFFKDFDGGEMYLSKDASTVTVIRSYTDDKTNYGKVGIISIDVSDVNNIALKGQIIIDGSVNTSRMVDGKLLLISNFYFNRSAVDYNDPKTFVPTINSGNGAQPIEFEDIIYPDEITGTRYSVVALLDPENLELLGANALLNFTNDVYVSENNVYITREYTSNNEEGGRVSSANMTDVVVLNYSGESLEKRGVITVRGFAEDQYSFDERDGYLRVVTSTLENSYVPYDQGGMLSEWITRENVSLYIYDLKDNSLAYSLEDFAIEGEEATAVRFDGDMVYVCTAVVVNFTDPVYFIDLSDYENIESADTGIIEGYSEHLINLGEGFLLGIGRENWSFSKVEIYEQQGDAVVSVDVFRFDGDYSDDYKAYLVNRENNLFGFATHYLYLVDEDNGGEYSNGTYVLLQFNGYELSAIIIDIEDISLQPDTVRAAYIDGYLYITTPIGLQVERIK